MDVRCFDVVNMVADEATSQFGSLLKVDEGKKKKLEGYCVLIDKAVESFDGESLEVDINDETTDITITLVCAEFETSSVTKWFYDLSNQAKAICIKAHDNEHIEISFTFNGIWSKAF